MAAASQVSTEVDGEILVLNTNTSAYYTLGAVGAHVWRLLRRPVTLTQICSDVASTYEVAAEGCRADVLVLLRQLLAAGLVELQEGEAPETPEPGASAEPEPEYGIRAVRGDSDAHDSTGGEPGG